jgi:translation initiation factor 3 subunit L
MAERVQAQSYTTAQRGEAPQRQQAAFFGQDVDDDEFIGDDGDVDLGIPDAYANSGFMDESALAESQVQQQVAAAAAQQAAAQALAAIPDAVRKYIVLFRQAVNNGNLAEITTAYEASWNRLTEKFYQRTEWPEAEVIAPLVEDDQKFLTLYRELWYRHVYSRLSPDGEDRFHSYDNYCDFFNFVLNSEGPVPLELPSQWLWDIIDEFIYQFQSYSQWRNRVSAKSEDELLLLQDGGVWSSYSVLNVLYSLIQKSRIVEQLQAAHEGEDPDEVAGEFGSRSLYKQLGYFSIIGLLRVHVLMGDYTLALKMLDTIDLHKKAQSTVAAGSASSGSGLPSLNRVTACHVTCYYYVAFAYIMLRRYPDAIRCLSHILVFIMRLRQYHTRSWQYDQIAKTGDRMYALLAIVCALCPTRLDENVQTAMRDKYGEQFGKMSKGGEEGLAAFEELFLYACPKFITGNGPPYHDDEALRAFYTSPIPDPAQHQVRIFLSDVKSQLSNANIRSFLRLYTTLGTDKLANFLEVNQEDLVEELMVAKASSRSVKWNDGGLLEGEIVNTSDLDFVIDTDMVHIAESRVGRKYGEWFLRQGVRMHQTLQHIKSKPLPIVDEKAQAAHAAAAAAAAAAGNASQNADGNKSSRTGQQGRTGGGAAKGAWGAPRASAAVVAAAGPQPNGAAATTA